MDVRAQVSAAYPRVGERLKAYAVRGGKGSDGRLLEYYPQGERDSFDPSRPAIEVFSNRMGPADIAGEVVSHDMAQGGDPRVTEYYDRFRQGMTPRQQDVLRGQYGYAQEHFGEDRSFPMWRDVSGIPAYLRGYTFKQWDDAGDLYTPNQRRTLDQLGSYLRSPSTETSSLRAALQRQLADK